MIIVGGQTWPLGQSRLDWWQRRVVMVARSSPCSCFARNLRMERQTLRRYLLCLARSNCVRLYFVSLVGSEVRRLVGDEGDANFVAVMMTERQFVLHRLRDIPSKAFFVNGKLGFGVASQRSCDCTKIIFILIGGVFSVCNSLTSSSSMALQLASIILTPSLISVISFARMGRLSFSVLLFLRVINKQESASKSTSSIPVRRMKYNSYSVTVASKHENLLVLSVTSSIHLGNSCSVHILSPVFSRYRPYRVLTHPTVRNPLCVVSYFHLPSVSDLDQYYIRPTLLCDCWNERTQPTCTMQRFLSSIWWSD